MTSKAYKTGVAMGWDWARAFPRMSRAAKRGMVAKLRRMAENYGDFARGLREGIADKAALSYEWHLGDKGDRLAEALNRLT